MPQTAEPRKMHTPGSWESLKQQCTFEFNGARCGLKEGHEGAHVSEEALEGSEGFQ